MLWASCFIAQFAKTTEELLSKLLTMVHKKKKRNGKEKELF